MSPLPSRLSLHLTPFRCVSTHFYVADNDFRWGVFTTPRIPRNLLQPVLFFFLFPPRILCLNKLRTSITSITDQTGRHYLIKTSFAAITSTSFFIAIAADDYQLGDHFRSSFSARFAASGLAHTSHVRVLVRATWSARAAAAPGRIFWRVFCQPSAPPGVGVTRLFPVTSHPISGRVNLGS